VTDAEPKCGHGRPLAMPYNDCARCALEFDVDYRCQPVEYWFDQIESFASLTDTPLGEFVALVPLGLCQNILRNIAHAKPSPDRKENSGVVVQMASGDLLVRPSRGEDALKGIGTLMLRGDVVAKARFA
jgi:hypothetical protein